jgi:hypothetical protein
MILNRKSRNRERIKKKIFSSGSKRRKRECKTLISMIFRNRWTSQRACRRVVEKAIFTRKGECYKNNNVRPINF